MADNVYSQMRLFAPFGKEPPPPMESPGIGVQPPGYEPKKFGDILPTIFGKGGSFQNLLDVLVGSEISEQIMNPFRPADAPLIYETRVGNYLQPKPVAAPGTPPEIWWEHMSNLEPARPYGGYEAEESGGLEALLGPVTEKEAVEANAPPVDYSAALQPLTNRRLDITEALKPEQAPMGAEKGAGGDKDTLNKMKNILALGLASLGTGLAASPQQAAIGQELANKALANLGLQSPQTVAGTELMGAQAAERRASIPTEEEREAGVELTIAQTAKTLAEAGMPRVLSTGDWGYFNKETGQAEPFSPTVQKLLSQINTPKKALDFNEQYKLLFGLLVEGNEDLRKHLEGKSYMSGGPGLSDAFTSGLMTADDWELVLNRLDPSSGRGAKGAEKRVYK